VATVDDTTYQGSTHDTLTIQSKAAFVTPNAAGKVYGDNDPSLDGRAGWLLEADGVTATYSRTPGEAAGSYTISGALSLTKN